MRNFLVILILCLGLNMFSQEGSIEAENGIIVGDDLTSTTDGTIRFDGTDFFGLKDGNWISMTGSSLWNQGVGSINYLNNVGVGTATPQAGLHVESFVPTTGIRVTRNGTSVITDIWSDFNEGGIGTKTNHDFRFLTNNTFRGEISANGNWGIGTGNTNPLEQLDVAGAIKIQNTSNDFPGTIKYTGSDFEGRVGTEWKSLTSNSTVVITESGALNINSYDLTDQMWTAIGPTVSFTKGSASSVIEISCNTNVNIASMTGFGVQFEIRVNGMEPDYSNIGNIQDDDLEDDISCTSIFDGLPAGTHTAQIYTRSPNGGSTATGIVLDPGGWGARILVREY